jgi:chitin synthase
LIHISSAAAGRRTPTVIIVKCGTEAEARTDKKPGNRGKRDSQLILMNFFSCVTYNDRMTPLEFDLFRKIHVLMGVTPDFFEVCLMVRNSPVAVSYNSNSCPGRCRY